MIRFTPRTVVGLVGSAIMTVCSFLALIASLPNVDSRGNTRHAAPVALHSDTMAEWQLAEKDLVVVRASRV